MLSLDDAQLYDLSEAGPLLFKDPIRLGREARIRLIPSAQVGPLLGLPAPWVDAESGKSNADAISLASYWLGRLAPPAAGARKPVRARSKLPCDTLLSPGDAARALFATPPALERLEREGRMPAIRVDDDVCYDAALVELMSAGAGATALESRRAEVRGWARYEYRTTAEAEAPPPAAAWPAPAAPASPSPGAWTPGDSDAPMAEPSTPESDEATVAASDPESALPEAPRAFEMPSDLLEIDGFETVDED